MQQEKQLQYKGTNDVLEFIGASEIGEKNSPNKPFDGRAIAKVIRNTSDVDMVAVMYDTTYERPYVIFDPNCNDGLVVEFVFVYTYDWNGIKDADAEMKSPSYVSDKPISSMKAEEVDVELMYVYGMKEAEVKEYRTVASRKALLAQKRDEKAKSA